MAAADWLYIVVKGRQTHGAQPWGGVDPIVVASQIVLGLQTIASRQIERDARLRRSSPSGRSTAATAATSFPTA